MIYLTYHNFYKIFFNIEKILITDFSCKSTDNPEKDLEYKDLPLGYGGKRLK